MCVSVITTPSQITKKRMVCGAEASSEKVLPKNRNKRYVMATQDTAFATPLTYSSISAYFMLGAGSNREIKDEIDLIVNLDGSASGHSIPCHPLIIC